MLMGSLNFLLTFVLVHYYISYDSTLSFSRVFENKLLYCCFNVASLALQLIYWPF